MRTLFSIALATTLIGCSCNVPLQQTDVSACSQTNGYVCFDGTADSALIELKPSVKASPAKKEVKRTPAKKASPPSVKAGDGGTSEKAKSIAEVPATGQPTETSDPVTKKAKTAIAAKIGGPASAEFGEMKRAMRKNTLGQFVDTICGHVKWKNASSGATEERPFLYLVKDDDAYVVTGGANSVAATAYRNICN